MTLIKEHRPGLWLTELELDDFDVRGALIIGTDRAVVWDSLSHPRDMAPLLPLIEGKTLVIVYSHADWDHAWGSEGLPSDSGLIIGHADCLVRFSSDVPQTLQDFQASQPGLWENVVIIPPNLTFQDELNLSLGDITLTLHHLPGHTLDCIVGFIPEWGLLLAGDTVETPLPVVNEDSPLRQWIALLQRWAGDTRVEQVIPSHGSIGGRELIRHNIDYLQAVLDGREIDLPDNPPAFYRDTHQTNLRHAKNYVRQQSKSLQ